MGCVKSKNEHRTIEPTTIPKIIKEPNPINTQAVHKVLFIWLDANIDESLVDCQKTITHFRQTLNNIHMFTDAEACLQFLKAMTNQKACLVISGSLGKQMISHVNNLSQVDSIFIFCGNKKNHEEWIKDWSKIKGVFTNVKPLCEAMKQAAQQYDQSTTSASPLTRSNSLMEKFKTSN